jgi:hypothetical protein
MRRNEPLLLHILHHLHTTRPALQRIPNGEETTFTVFSPLMIPKSQFLNVLFLQKCAALLVVLHLLRDTVLKTVKLDVQPRCRAIEIQEVNSNRMLAAKFESREAMASQRAPELFFLIGLVTTKLAGGLD